MIPWEHDCKTCLYNTEPKAKACEECRRDLVEVVRCKDCVSYGTSISGVPCEGYCKQLEYTTRKDDDFCSWGRRKNEAH